MAGFLVNKFRGDVRLLQPGLDQLAVLTGRPTLGVLPWLDGLELDVEDSLSLPAAAPPGRPALGDDVLRISVARLPRLSNVTDLDALAAEPGVLVRYCTRPEELADADLVILPGTRATVTDLAWLRSTGLADAVLRQAAAGVPVLGICGGAQMLARTITDDVESRAGTVPGLGLLPADVRFRPDKTLGRPAGSALGQPVRGYEIHHGVRDPRRRRGALPRRRPLGLRVRHDLARRPGERRLPPGLPRRGRPAHRPAASSSPPTPTSPPSARLGSTASATWSPSTPTPTRSGG